MIRFFLIIAVFLGLSFPATVGADSSAQKRKIIVGGDHNYPPYEFLENGKPTGFDIELMRAVADVMGFEVEFRLAPWNKARQDLEEGRLDALAGMYYSVDRSSLVDFSVPHTQVTPGLFLPGNSPIRSFADIQGKEIVVQEGDVIHDALKRMDLASRIVTVTTAEQVLQLLASGRHDCAIMPSRLQGEHYAKNLGLTNIRIINTDLPLLQYCFAVRKGDQELLARLDEGLNILKVNGKYREIHEKWFGVSEEKDLWDVVRYYVLAIAFAAALCLVFVIWSRMLKRLVEQRTAELRKSEEALRFTQYAIDNATDHAFWMTEDGRLFYVNPAACSALGYSREELAEMSISDIDPSHPPEVFAEHWRNLQAHGSITMESFHRAKNGRTYPVEIRANYVVFDGREYNCAFATDISERKRMEEELRHAHDELEKRVRERTAELRSANEMLQREITVRKRAENVNMARLRLLECAATHNMDELLQATLDEAEALTKSLIGFYHFLEADQRTISLQDWSARTKAEFCKAEGKGRHYDISDAGVWVDCVRERRPVVHNDYGSLPHRKGLPSGHAPLIRELVVPVFRGDKIVAVFGVGNKPLDYTSEDVEAVSMLADLAWEIVERKKAEEALHLSRFCIDKAGIGIWQSDEKGTIFNVNDHACKSLGYSKEELGALSVFDIDPEITPERMLELKEKLAERGAVTHHSTHMRRDGTTFPVEITSNDLEFRGKRYGISFVQDITERKRAEEALRESETRLKMTMDIAKLVQWEYDVESGMFTFDDQFYALYGTTVEREGGTLMSADDYARKFLPHEESAVVAGGLAEVLANSSNQLEHRIIRTDGEERVIVVRGEAVRDEAGCIVKIRGANQDITERKRMEELLRKSEAAQRSMASQLAQKSNFLRTLIDAIPDLISYKDCNRAYLGCNRAFEAFAGRPECDLIGSTDLDIFSRDVAVSFREMDKEILSAEVCRRYEEGIEYPDGRQVLLETLKTPFFDLDGEILGVVGVSRDITERKRMEEALRESESRVRRKLSSILDPEGDIGELDLADILDTQQIQALLKDLYRITDLKMSIIDLQGRVLADVGWQDICLKFHRNHPETLKRCHESDTELTVGVPEGEFKTYRCKNNMWHLVTPIVVGGKHMANLFLGQFFFAGEKIDYDLFRAQARTYGFPEEDYIAALEAVPHHSEELVNLGKAVFARLTEMLSKLSYANIKLGQSLAERDRLTATLQRQKRLLQELNETLEKRVGEEVAKNREKDVMLIQQNRQAAMGELLDHIAHQWKQPLTIISLLVQNLEGSYVSGGLTDRVMHETIAKTLDLLEHMDQTVEVFRDFYRPDKEKTVFRVKDAVDKALDFMAPALKCHSIAVELDFDPDILAIGYPKEYTQVILNLLSNARDAFRDRRTEKPKIAITGAVAGNQAVITITDNAGGIPESIFPRIFDLYVTTKEAGGGTGIGLHMAKTIIEKNMQGSLTAFNSSFGAQFRIAVEMPEVCPLVFEEMEWS